MNHTCRNTIVIYFFIIIIIIIIIIIMLFCMSVWMLFMCGRADVIGDYAVEWVCLRE